MERGDGVALGNLTNDGERLITGPSSGLRASISIEDLLIPGHDAGELLVGGCPGVEDLGSGGLAKDGTDGGKQVVTDEGIVLRLYFEAGVLMADTANHSA